MFLLQMLSDTILPSSAVERHATIDPATHELWRRYRAAAARLRRAGLGTVADERAGSEAYVALRGDWQRYVSALAPTMAYTMEEIDPATSGRASAADERDHDLELRERPWSHERSRMRDRV